MINVNAVVYRSKEDKKYVAECYEIAQIGAGDSMDEAKSELVRALEDVVEMARADKTLRIIDGEYASKICRQGLQRVIAKEAIPEVREVNGLRVNFYDGKKRGRKDNHAGDCTIYASLINNTPESGICTCGYGWRRVREGDWSEMYSKELQEKEKKHFDSLPKGQKREIRKLLREMRGKK